MQFASILKSRKAGWFGVAVLSFLLVAASHWPERNGYFLVDDFLWLHLANWRSVADSFVGSQGAHVAYRPVFRLSMYVDYLLFGRQAAGWHWENMLLHAGNATLLAALLRAFGVRFAVSLAAAMLFSLAPLSGEGVNWISGRTVVLSSFFGLLSLWRWAISTRQRRPPWAAVIWMILALATYEGAIVLPLVCACLAPLAVRQFQISWSDAARQVAFMLAWLVVFWCLRAVFLGTLVGQTAAPSYDLWENFVHHLHGLLVYARNLGGDHLLWILAGCFALATLTPRLFPAGPCLALVALVLIAPYSQDAGTGGRFFYALQAPLCALLVLPAVVLPEMAAAPVLVLLLATLLPTFFASTRQETIGHTLAEQKARAIVEAVQRAIPRNDGYPHVVDGVPDIDRQHLLIGDFFEIAIADSYVERPPPVVLRTRTVQSNPQAVTDILATSSRFWRYDNDADRLFAISRDDWFKTIPTANDVSATLAPP